MAAAIQGVYKVQGTAFQTSQFERAIKKAKEVAMQKAEALRIYFNDSSFLVVKPTSYPSHVTLQSGERMIIIDRDGQELSTYND